MFTFNSRLNGSKLHEGIPSHWESQRYLWQGLTETISSVADDDKTGQIYFNGLLWTFCSLSVCLLERDYADNGKNREHWTWSNRQPQSVPSLLSSHGNCPSLSLVFWLPASEPQHRPSYPGTGGTEGDERKVKVVELLPTWRWPRSRPTERSVAPLPGGEGSGELFREARAEMMVRRAWTPPNGGSVTKDNFCLSFICPRVILGGYDGRWASS